MQNSRRAFMLAGIAVAVFPASELRLRAGELVKFVSNDIAVDPGEVSQAAVSLIQLEPLANSKRSPVVTAMALHAESETLAAAGDDHAIRWIDLRTGRTLAVLEGHLDWVRQLHFIDSTVESMKLMSCGDDGKVYMWQWDLQAQAPSVVRKKLLEVNHTLTCMAWSPIHETYAVGGFSHDIYFGNLVKAGELRKFQCNCGDQRALIFTPDGSRLVAGGRDGAIHLINVDQATLLRDVSLHRGRIRSMALSEDGRTLTTVGEDRFIHRVDWETGDSKLSMRLTAGKLLAVEHLNGTQLAVASADNTVQVVDFATGQVLNRLVGHDGSVAVLLYRNSRLFTAGFDTTIRVWNLDSQATASNTPGTRLIQHPIRSRFLDSGVLETTN